MSSSPSNEPLVDFARAPLPRITASLPGTGGVIRATPEDFVVEEVPEITPSGRGEHLWLWIEKRELSTPELVELLARELNVPGDSVGTAGLKDKHAVTRQTVSVPSRTRGRVEGLEIPGVRILAAELHPERLRTGRHRGNRFELRLTQVPHPERAEPIAAALRASGLPNYFGPQRFGHGLNTLELGLRIVRGEPVGRRGGLKRLALSAVQSALYNEVLARRLRDGLFGALLTGDVVHDATIDSPIVVTDPATQQARLATRKLIPMGPMFGLKLRETRHEALERELAVLADAKLSMEDFGRERELMAGARRPYHVWLDDLVVTTEADSVRLCVTLPPGAYATVLLAEVMKTVLDEATGEAAAEQ